MVIREEVFERGKEVDKEKEVKFLERLKLYPGRHEEKTAANIMEACGYVAGEEWTNRPECVSVILRLFTISLNNKLPGTPRQRLKQYIPQLINSNGDDRVENKRAWMVCDWLIRTALALWLDKAGYHEEGEKITALRRICSMRRYQKAYRVIKRIDPKRFKINYAIFHPHPGYISSLITYEQAEAMNVCGVEAAIHALGTDYDEGWEEFHPSKWEQGITLPDLAYEITDKIFMCQDKMVNAIIDKCEIETLRAKCRQAFKPCVLELQESAFKLIGRLLKCSI